MYMSILIIGAILQRPLSAGEEPGWYIQLHTENATKDSIRNYTILAIAVYHLLSLLKIDPQQTQLASIPTTGLLISLCHLVEMTGEVGSFVGDLLAAAYLVFLVIMTFIAPFGRQDKWAMLVFCIYAQAFLRYLSIG